jgi:glutamyl-Q tRNA(Asp) synthetase
MADETKTHSAVTRFAPSPTGYLHLGHAYAALFARAAGDRFLLRIEDIDRTRCKPEFEAAILDDLAWLGLSWERPVRRQSEHFGDYVAALAKLDAMELLYPCFCTRSDIANAGDAPHGPDGPIYPGTCRTLDAATRARRIADGASYALRLDVAKAVARTGALSWRDLDRGLVSATPEAFGDVVLARKDTPASYHLAVSVDDDLQGVTLVTRGEDLRAATHVHRLLQALLGLQTPEYRFHKLLTDERGHRLAKRDQAATLKSLRETGASSEEVRRRAGF